MRRKFHMFLLLFLLLINCLWTYGIHTKDDQVDYILFFGNDVGEDPALTIDDITNGPCSLYVSWTCSNCPSSFDGYNVTWQQTGEDKESTSSLVSYRSSYYPIENLISDQTYTVRVAVVINGEETDSDEKQKSTTEGEPGEITGVAAEQVNDNVNVSWDESTNICPIQGYRVTWNGTSIWNNTLKFKGSQDTEENTLEVQDLAPYSIYDFYVSEITSDGILGEPSDPATIETEEGAASPPDPVTSFALGSYSAQVNWGFPEEPNGVILGYHVSCLIFPGSTDDCDLLINDTEIFTANATDLRACGNYTFIVRAINSFGFGEPGTDSSTTDPEPPPHFTNFGYVNLTSTSVVLTWDPLATSCPVTKYIIHVEEKILWKEGTTDFFDKTYSGEDNYYLLEGLIPYSQYDITIRATTEGGTTEDTDSNRQQIVTMEDEADAPAFLNSSTIDEHTVSLNWSPPENANGILTGYVICYKEKEEKVSVCPITTNEKTLQYDVENLDACGDYNFTVQAENRAGKGEKASTMSTTDSEAPPHFTNFSYENLTSTSVVLTWDPLETTCHVIRYSIHGEVEILWKEDETDPLDKNFLGEHNYYLLDDLIPYSQYDISIQASTKGGTTEVTDSDRQQIVTLQDEADAPSAINSSTIDEHTVSLNWSPPENANGILTGYVICYKKKEEKVSDCPVTTNEKTLQYDVENLDACGDYNFTVQAENGAGKGEKASTNSLTDSEKPGEIGNVEIVTLNSTSMVITFDAPETSCEILGYDIEGVGTYKWNNHSYEYKDTLVVTSDGEYVVPNLIPYSSYVFNMSATTAGGTTGGVMFEGETAKDVPSEPNNLKATALDSTQIKVTWDEPEYQNGDNLKSYYLTYELFGSESGSIEVIDTKQYTIGAVGHENEKLLPCETYTVRVRASNEVGNGTAAADQKATLYPGVPHAVDELSCSTTGSESIDIFWEVHHSSCVIQYYEISLIGEILWDGTTNNTRNVSTHDTSLILSGLIPCTSYDITLTPATEAGLGEPKTCTCETDPDVPSAPTNLFLKDITTSNFTVFWEDPEFENGSIFQYLIYLYQGETIIENNATVPYNESSSLYEYKFEDLDSQTPYEVSVAAENEIGAGASAVLQVITL